MRNVLDTIERWLAEGLRVAAATVVRTERSAPRELGATMAVSERGDLAGSVTGGCVEPAVYEEAQAVLRGEGARLVSYGIADEDAFEVGLPCGGTVDIVVFEPQRDVVGELVRCVRAEEPVALRLTTLGAQSLVPVDGRLDPVFDADTFVLPFLPRPNLYVFGAVDHAAALARVGRLLGYRVTVCDPRAKFVTAERVPEADKIVVDWPDRFLAGAPIDERTAICVLTHDHKIDVPALKAALASPAVYVGAMGSRRTNEERARLLGEEGVGEEELARLHAPIGLDIGSRTPEEVAVAVAAEIVAVRRARAGKTE
jgi:xanthine dehydrogenase accessory factor